jgi:hypothetical protein
MFLSSVWRVSFIACVALRSETSLKGRYNSALHWGVPEFVADAGSHLTDGGQASTGSAFPDALRGLSSRRNPLLRAVVIRLERRCSSTSRIAPLMRSTRGASGEFFFFMYGCHRRTEYDVSHRFSVNDQVFVNPMEVMRWT